MLTLYPIRDLNHMETVHAHALSREISRHQNESLRLKQQLFESDAFQATFPKTSLRIPSWRNGTFENFTRFCHIPGKGYIPEIRRKVVNWETVTGHQIYTSWNLSPKEMVCGDLGREIQFVTTAAVEVLRREMPELALHSVANLYLRYRGTVGREYVLDMAVRNGSYGVVERRVSLLLPHTTDIIFKNDPAVTKTPQTTTTTTGLTRINFIVPLNGLTRKKVAKFQRTFYSICVRKPENCRLIYVIFSRVRSEINFMQTYLTRFKRRHPKFLYDYIIGGDEYNQTRGYELGLARLGDNDLAFVASVELSLASHFLKRCRRFASRGRKIYYPELFMYYNMPYVYRGKWHPKSYDFSRLHGRWATRAVVCAYKSDYVRIGGYDTLRQWEVEPGSLQVPVGGSLGVVRAPDPGISHHYQPMRCDTNLPPQQFSRCLSTQSDNLADRISLAGYLFSLEAKCGEESSQRDGEVKGH